MGSGFRVWTAGEVVSASNVNNYLQEQAVMSFAGTAARSSAIASPEEGMLSYLQDSDTYQGYDGAAWVNLGTLSGASDSGLVHINTQSFSAVSATSLPNDTFTSTYSHYRLLFIVNAVSTNNQIGLRFRTAGTDNSTANYARQVIGGESSTAFAGQLSGQTSVTLGAGNRSAPQLFHFDIFNPKATEKTSFIGQYYQADTNQDMVSFGGYFNATTSFDSLSMIANLGTITGTYSVFAYKN